MQYEFVAIPDDEVPQAANRLFQHLVTTYASETNKTISMWRAVPEIFLDFKPHEKTNSIRNIMVHQILSERRFFAQFVGTQEPPVEELLPPGDKPTVQAYIDKYLWLAKQRLPQLAAGTEEWWLTSDAVLRRPATGANMDLLAACAAHLPSSNPGADVAPFGRSARSGDLRPIRRREVERGRSNLLSGGGKAWRIGQRDRHPTSCRSRPLRR